MRMETQVMSTGEGSLVPVPILERHTKPTIPIAFESTEEAFYMLEVLRSQILHFLARAARFLAEHDSQPEAFEMLAPSLWDSKSSFKNGKTPSNLF